MAKPNIRYQVIVTFDKGTRDEFTTTVHDGLRTFTKAQAERKAQSSELLELYADGVLDIRAVDVNNISPEV